MNGEKFENYKKVLGPIGIPRHYHYYIMKKESNYTISTAVSYLIKKKKGVLSMNIKELIMGVINQQELLNYYNASVIYEELPCVIRGFVFNHDGVYFIILSKYLSYYKRKKTLLHELAHIELNQLCQSNKDLFAFFIDNYEDEADKYIKEIMKEV